MTGHRNNLPNTALRLLVALTALLVGCKATPGDDVTTSPGGTGLQPAMPRGVYAVIRRADVPLDQPTDRAWAIINEQVVPPLTRGAWRGNGLRMGVLRREQLDDYAAAMPQPVAFGQTAISRSKHPVPIIQTALLPAELRLRVDLTQPPRPRNVATLAGGKNSRLRLLARIETDEQGQHTLVLTPHHHVPSPLTLIPRDPLEKELDGRLFDELTVRLKLGSDQVAVVGLYWPWPQPVPAGIAPAASAQAGQAAAPRPAPTRVVPADPSDPAAPPPHLTPGNAIDSYPPGGAGVDGDDPDLDKPAPPPLATSLGSTLLTGTHIAQPVHTVLLITIEQPQAQEQ